MRQVRFRGCAATLLPDFQELASLFPHRLKHDIRRIVPVSPDHTNAVRVSEAVASPVTRNRIVSDEIFSIRRVSLDDDVVSLGVGIVTSKGTLDRMTFRPWYIARFEQHDGNIALIDYRDEIVFAIQPAEPGVDIVL